MKTNRTDVYRTDAALRPSGPIRAAIEKTRLFMRMLWDRSYKTSWITKLTALGGLLYLVIPADLLPDVVPIVGLIDDVAILGLVVNQFRQEVARYEHFLKATGSTVSKKAVRKSAYQRAVEEVESVGATPAPVGQPAAARQVV